MLATIKRDWRSVLFQSVVTAFAFVVFLVGASAAAGSLGSQKQQVKLADVLLRSNLAQACELALPVGPEGRDPSLVTLCFTQYQLQPPLTHN